MEIEVTGPELHLVSTPSNPKVGQEGTGESGGETRTS